MSKYFKIFLLTMLVVSLLASAAMAGTTGVNHLAAGDNFKISAQALGVDRNFTMNGSAAGVGATGTNAIEYTLGQQLTSGNFIVVTFDSGIAFQAGQYALCSAKGAAANNVLAIGTPGANATSYNFQVGQLDATANVAAGNKIWLTQDTTCGTADAKNVGLKVIANTAKGNKNVTISGISSGNIPSDSSSSNRVVTIQDEYAGALTAADVLTIDYIGSPGNGTRFTAATNIAGSSNKLAITRTHLNLQAGNLVGGAANNAAGLNATLVFQLADSQGWQGVNKIYAADGTACPASTAAGAIGVVNAPASGNASINVSGAGFNGSGGAVNNISICIETKGDVALQTRTITGNYTIGMPTGGLSMPTSATEVYQTWNLNAYQGLIPWIVKSDGLKTYCVINNGSALDANVWLTTFSSESGSAIASLLLGTLPTNKTKLYIFGDKVVEGTNEYNLTGLSAGDRYSATVTVSVNRDSVTMSCNQFDPGGTGIKRLVPVLTDNAGSKWKQ